MKIHFWLIFLLAICTTQSRLYAQGVITGHPSAVQLAPLQAVINVRAVKSHLSPVLSTISIYQDADYMDFATPSNKTPLPHYTEDNRQPLYKDQPEAPVLISSFDGYNDNQYTPTDNSLAISSQGIIVSVMNSSFRIFKDGQQEKFSSFYDLYKGAYPYLKGLMCDPRVIFDGEAQRFIMTMLYQDIADSSRVLVMFSKTEDPMDGWNLYTLKGNALNKHEWLDYPNIAVSDKELFITGNLFHDDKSYGEPVVLQINKFEGYNGQSLQYQAWGDILDTWGKPAFTLVPATYSKGDTSSGMYFVSNKFDMGTHVNLYHITGAMGTAGVIMTRTSMLYPFTYFAPGASQQKGSSHYLNAGDSRIKQAFIHNNIIHYVFAAMNPVNRNSTIVYARIDLATNFLTEKVLGEDGSNYTYPSLVSMAQSKSDKSAMIAYEKAGSDFYPELDVVYCDDAMNFSNSTVAQAGSSAINESSGHVERWGDYSDIVKDTNNNAIISGAYGKVRRWQTEIAEVGLQSQQKTAIQPAIASPVTVEIYPNPSIDRFSIQFKMVKKGPLNISLYNMQGQVVDILYNGIAEEGEKRFTFNEGGLSSGIYFLEAHSAGEKILFSKKIERK